MGHSGIDATEGVLSMIFLSFITSTMSASWIVLSLWAMTKLVLPSMSLIRVS